MFLLALIGVILIIYFIIIFVKSIADDKYYKNDIRNVVYTLAEHYEDISLTDYQKEVVDFLQENISASEREIINTVMVGKTVITALKKKNVIVEYQKSKKDHKQLIVFIVSVVLLIGAMILADYYFLIKINFRYYGLFFYIFLFVLLTFGLYASYRQINASDKVRLNTFIITGMVGIVMFLIIFGGRTYFYAEEYSNLIEVSEADFIEDIQTVNVENLPLVDKAYGYKLGQLKLGEYPGIGSEFEAGEYSDIIYQGKQYLVAPLEYRDIFKWLNNRNTGTPGYILINKVTAVTQFVNLRETTGEGLLYTPSAFFNQDLVRYAYYNGMAKYKLENQFFEIDEEGTPYYVLQYSLPTIFINGGAKINKIAVVNATNGEINIYNPGQEPDWVESVYPDSIIFQQLDYWGALQDGWLNSIFAQRGVLQPSDGTRVIMNEGELYYFTGLTSAGNDESTIGFVYSGMKTKETRLFRFPGATEDAAMDKVITLLPQNNISTSFPIPINVEDIPTYFILIKGEDGRILRYVYISVQDLELYSMSENKNEAYNNYLVKLSETSDATAEEVVGIITDIVFYVTNGNTIYWIELDNDKRYKINVSNFSDSELGYFTSLDIGDSITISVMYYNVVEITIE